MISCKPTIACLDPLVYRKEILPDGLAGPRGAKLLVTSSARFTSTAAAVTSRCLVDVYCSTGSTRTTITFIRDISCHNSARFHDVNYDL